LGFFILKRREVYRDNYREASPACRQAGLPL